MRIFLLIILLIHSAVGALLLNENLYERNNRIDLMLSFDTPFSGTIKKKRESDGTIDILLNGIEVQKPFRENVQNSFVESIALIKSGPHTALIKIVPLQKPLQVEASKTIDGFGLRLRITPTAESSKSLSALPAAAISDRPKTAKPLNTLQSSQTLPGWRYWSVLAILLLLLIVLWIVKKRSTGTLSGKSGWLMPKAGLPGNLPEEAVVRYQKVLDPHNRLLLLEFGGKQYLMVVGNSNLLLDTFVEGKIEDADTFSQMFEANKKQLDNFLKENHPDAYEAFKANASKEEHL
ncbi:hypothetical protein [Hydrogenimonas cancrithermarum]|uniref:Membrane protein n=1 Tax=Hydrogenimonas cancrithermarum TaxID=2993563 RepID=A0ABM8FJ59_9BACT|nr:hypothetical protein [Hydrogenimonas cancrithermarum]BDY12316.1 membrane protein [Hydrogenimonas cancrithermarum]